MAAKRIGVIVAGANGRMGREVVKAVSEQKDMRLAGAFDSFGCGCDAGEAAGIGKLGIEITGDLKQLLKSADAQVVVDFTIAEGFEARAMAFLGAGLCPVVGTTGIPDAVVKKISAKAAKLKKGAIIVPNFAIGAVMMMKFAAIAAQYMPAVEIIELHHDKKLDAPSGTAMYTAQLIVDAKKGAIFTKYGRLITIAAKKGSDPTTNFSLRMAMEKAREANMPKENIERAIKRGTGELGGAQIEELTYEGIGPAKSQFIIKCLTDNKNRTAAEIRHLLADAGGSLGAVLWNFELKGVILITAEELKNKNLLNNDDFELELIDAGVENFVKESEGATIYTKPEDLQKVKQFLETKSLKTESAETEYVAKDHGQFSDEEKEKVQKFIDTLENNEDITNHYTNAIV